MAKGGDSDAVKKVAITAIASAALAVGACGSEDDEKPEKPRVPAGDVEIVRSGAFQTAKVLCQGLGPEYLAKQIGLDVDIKMTEGLARIAEEYTKDNRRSRDASADGCLSGLRKFPG